MQAHYLSTQNEFIMACGEIVFVAIIEEIRTAIYFSMIVDVTPDVSHTEAITFVFQFVRQSMGSEGAFTEFEKSGKKEGCRHFEADYGRFGSKLNLVKELLRERL